VLHRHVLGYVPATLVPALASFAAIFIFTRLLSPEAFGTYALATSIALVCQLVLFHWLQMGATRFSARADTAAGLGLSAAVYRSFAVAAALCAVGYGAAVVWLHRDAPLDPVFLLGLPLVLLRALIAVNQAFHRGALRVLRFNAIECGQAIVGLVLGLLLVAHFRLGAAGVLLGLIGGSALVALPDLPRVLRGLRAPVDRAEVRALMRYGLPLTGAVALDYVLSTSDRLLIGYFVGPAAVGVYAVSYSLVDRALSSVSSAISVATFPLLMRAFEREGTEAARAQMYKNGTALMALTLPAAAGIILANQHLANVLVGAAFRAQAVAIMPWIAVSGFLAGLQLHYFAHAFHLAGRTEMFVVSNAPAALLNLVLNIVLLPRIGVMGAVYATVVSYAVAATSSALIGRRLFRMQHPWRPALRIAGATAFMVVVVRLAGFPATELGLAQLVVVGALSYVLGAILLDVGGVRALVRARLTRKPVPVRREAAGE
jgi:O-antigen/teichoic acid export membrane protein